MKVAVVQMRSGADPWANLLQVQAFVQEAEARGCEAVFFPENVFYRGPKKSEDFERSEIFLGFREGKIDAESEFSRALAECAAQWKLHVSLGSVLERNPSGGLPFNSHAWVAPGGQVAAVYRKIHLFDYQGSAGRYHESADVARGSDPVSVGAGGLRFALAICYDLRFPELFRALVLRDRCDVLTLPAAFTRETGQAHWHTLLRARAVENLSYLVAPAQWGAHCDSRGQELFCFGHALAYDPWGELLVEGPAEGDAVLCCELKVEKLKETRGRLPSLGNTTYFNNSFQGI